MLICLNNYRHDLSTVLIAQNFEGFNDLFTKARGIEIHLNKHKKNAKESDKNGHPVKVTVAPKERATYVVGCSHPKRLFHQNQEREKVPQKMSPKSYTFYLDKSGISVPRYRKGNNANTHLLE